jgi:phosphohistidine phosphatase
MTKTLTLVRHAKSSWDSPARSDFERPLNARGLADAPAMAQRLKRLPLPDLLLTSPAVRALSTARIFSEQFGRAPEVLETDARIYEASAGDLMKIIHGLDDNIQHVMLFGHNPGISELAAKLADCSFDDMPTCAAARIEFASNSWGKISAHSGKLVHYSYPKAGS